MKIIAELHTHSSEFCDHATHTIDELVAVAREMGFKYFATTNHGPVADRGTPITFYLDNIGREFEGIKFLSGVEADLRDLHGGLDFAQRDLLKLDFVIASMHGSCIETGYPDYTRALVALAENPAVDCLGHIARTPEYVYDLEAVLAAVKANGKLIEFNNSTIVNTPSAPACGHVMDRCAALGINCIVTNDAHFPHIIGHYEKTIEMLEERSFPEELIVNADEGRMEKFLACRKEEKKKAYDALFTV